jgi:prepilin peptidase CpaA
MHSFAWWPTVVVLAVATFTDLRSRRIPNWLVLPFMLAGLIVPGWLHGWHGFSQSVEGFGLGALVYGILSWIGGMGMGDVKLVAAIGAWIGPQQLIFAMVLTAMAGGLIALGAAVYGKFRGDVWKSRKIPYAPAIAVGTLISFFSQYSR